jgi:hypothetical protein
MAEADRTLAERVYAAVGGGPAGWTTGADVAREVYGPAPTRAQLAAIAAALSTLQRSGAVERVGDSFRRST